MVSQLRKAHRRRAEGFGTYLIWPNEQAHQLRAIVCQMRICAATTDYIASEIGTFRCVIFNVAYLGLRYSPV